MYQGITRLLLGCCLFLVFASWNRTCRATPRQESSESGGVSQSGETLPQDAGSKKPSPPPLRPEPHGADTSLGKHVVKDFVDDQKAIWTGPFHVRLVDAEWLVPLGGAAAAMFATDTEVSKHLSSSPNRISESNNVANYGVASLAAAAGGMYVWGHFTHNDHMRETGFLAGEAAADALATTYALKYSLRRERPLQDNYQGQFWHGGDSFPSEHSSAAWSIAGIIGHEYPGPLPSLLAYGLAAAISSSRVTAKQHFPSDVLIGSALGWLISQEVYRRHHDPTVGGGDWQTYAESHESGPSRPSNNVGSPYMELDSWVYPALDRLAGLGYFSDAFLGLRPWTRRECARLVQEAEDHGASPEADRLIEALQEEFAPELSQDGRAVHYAVNSFYTRYTNISGEPLRDSYHFAQTIVNDYGRPYAEGNNEITGGDFWGTAGPLVAYARVEYQHAPSFPALPLEARRVIQQVDLLPTFDVPPGTPAPAVNRVDLVEGYVGLQIKNWEITFGKQSEWWGPDRSGPMMFSDNAEPINMFRINRTSPFTLPSVLKYFGPIRVEVFVGQLAGDHIINTVSTGIVGSFTTYVHPQPLLNGQAFSFKPTPNLEFGFTRTTIFAGEGVAFTPHKLIQSIFSLGNGLPGANDDPGDRRSGFDLTYRLPWWFRGWMTFYADGFTDDQVTPVAYWDRSAWTSGLYFSKIPHLPKVDFRAEGIYTDLPIGGNLSHGFFYTNTHYLSGYTNMGNLIGSWIGREGQGADGWATYWFTPRSKLQLNYRHQKVSKQFIPNGGTLTDVGVYADFLVRNHFSVTGSVQYETWNFPVISPTQKTDVSTSIQFTYWPEFLNSKNSTSTAGVENRERSHRGL